VLHGCPEGTYLVRFSQSAVTGFAVAFVVADGSVEQVLVRSEVGRGFILEGGTCCVILPGGAVRTSEAMMPNMRACCGCECVHVCVCVPWRLFAQGPPSSL
jgi:hypothetical protein